MGLGIINTSYDRLSAEFKRTPPQSIVDVLLNISNLPPIKELEDDFLGFTDIRVGQIVYISGKDANGASSYRVSETLDFIDPNSVFVMPKYREIPYSSVGYIEPSCGYANSSSYTETDMELINIVVPSMFYSGTSNGARGHSIAIDRDTREIISHYCNPWIELEYRYGNYRRTELIKLPSLAFCCGDVTYMDTNTLYDYGSSMVSVLASYVGSFGDVCSLYTSALNTMSVITHKLYFSSPPVNYHQDYNISTCGIGSYYGMFKYYILTTSGEDLDLLFTMPDILFNDRIIDSDSASDDSDGDSDNADPYYPGGPSGPGGGDGNFGNDRPSDDITQLIPPGSASNSLTDAGIFSHYLVTARQLKGLGDWLFSDHIGDVLHKELIELWFGNTFDSIISLMSYPFAVGQLPSITTSPSNIYLGHFDTEAPSSGLLTNDTTQIDWGSISITEYWGNFLDYAPHTKIQLYLPWSTGFVDIDPNECMQGTLNVKTNIELTKGTCVHIVSNGNGTVIGTFTGFCGAQYPITSKDTSGKVIGAAISAISVAVAAGSAAAGAAADGAILSGQRNVEAARGAVDAGFWGRGGRILAEQSNMLAAAEVKSARYNSMASGAAKTAAVSSLAAARAPASFPRNGSFSPNASHLAIQVPYIIMTWPDQSVPEQYGNHVGYPSNIYYNLGRLRGYTEVGAIHLEGLNCTEPEREEILSLLQGGVIL